MLLLFLLVFASATNIDAEDYFIREETTTRLQILGPTCIPSMLLCMTNPTAEARLRIYPLLYPLRYQQQLLAINDFLDNGWPTTAAEAKGIYGSSIAWRALWEVVSVRAKEENLSVYIPLDPSLSWWEREVNNWDELRRYLNYAKIYVGKNKISWLLYQPE